MNNALQSSLSSHPGLTGILYADSNGLCISGEVLDDFILLNLMYLPPFAVAVGELQSKSAGRYCSISKVAGSIDLSSPPPVVLIETTDHHILVKECDANTVVLKCLPNSD